jgi:hypothetical protein
VQGALYICMNPLSPQTGPDATGWRNWRGETAAAGEIDDVAHLADDHVYLFTGSADQVVYSDVVARTRRFCELLGVKPEHIFYDDSVPAGHSIITDNRRIRSWPPTSRPTSTAAASCSRTTSCATSTGR